MGLESGVLKWEERVGVRVSGMREWGERVKWESAA